MFDKIYTLMQYHTPLKTLQYKYPITPLQKAIKYVSVTHIVLAIPILVAAIIAMLSISGIIAYNVSDIVQSIYSDNWYNCGELRSHYSTAILNSSIIIGLSILGIIYSKRSYLLPKSFIIVYAIIYLMVDALTILFLSGIPTDPK